MKQLKNIFFILCIIKISYSTTELNPNENGEYFINDMSEDEFIKYYTEKNNNFFNLKDNESKFSDIFKIGIDIIKQTILQEYKWEFAHNICTFACSFFLRKDICYAAIGRYGPILLESLFKRILDSNRICNNIYLCKSNIEYENSEDYIKRILKNKPKNKKIKILNNNEFKFIQITDIHLQLDYKEGSVSNCGIPLCCRNTPNELGWIHGKTNNGKKLKICGKYGSTGNCDGNLETLKSFSKEIKKLNPEFILFTGDNSAHNVWEVNQNEISYATEVIINTIKNEIGNNIPIYPAIGNHEKAPPDVAIGSETILYHGLSKSFRNYLTKDAYDSFSQYGYYTMLHKNTNLRIISLNCIICDSMNFHLISETIEVAKMFQWLEKILNDAEKNNEIIYLLDHIPIRTSQHSEDCTKRLKSLLDRYQNIIRGFISAHTHRDEITIVHEYYNEDKIININYIAPGLTTYSEFWPSYRLYISDEDTKFIKNYIQYRLNLDESNRLRKPIWYISYNASEFYNVTDMTDFEGISKANIDENYGKHYYTDNPELKELYTSKQEIENLKCYFHTDNFISQLKCKNAKHFIEHYTNYVFDHFFFAKWEKLKSLV